MITSSFWHRKTCGATQCQWSEPPRQNFSHTLRRASKLALLCSLLMFPVVLKAQLNTAKQFSLLSGNVYHAGPDVSASGLVGSLNTTVTNVYGGVILPQLDTNTANAASEVAAYKALLLASSPMQTHFPTASGDTIHLVPGLNKIAGGTYTNLILVGTPDSGFTSVLLFDGNTVLQNPSFVLGFGQPATSLVTLVNGKLNLSNASTWGIIAADSIVVNQRLRGVSSLYALQSLDLSAASVQISGDPNIGFTASEPTTVNTLSSRVVRACTTLTTPGNLVYNPSFTAFRFLDVSKLIAQPNLSVIDNSPACNWELTSPMVTPDLWYRYAITTQPNVCSYSCNSTAVPQNRYGAAIQLTDPNLPNAEEGAIGLESNSNYRESYVQQLNQPLAKGNYFAAFKMRGLKSICGPCITGSGNNTSFYDSYTNGLGLSISSFKPAFASPEIPNGRSVTGGYYHDDQNRAIVNTIEFNRTDATTRYQFYDWRLVSGRFNYDQGSNSTTYLTIGNFKEASLAGFSNNPEYHLVDQIELYRFPYVNDFTVCMNQSPVTQAVTVVGNLPASAFAQYEWTSPNGGVTFSSPNTLNTDITVPTTGSSTVTVVLKTTTRAYAGDSTLADGYTYVNQITYDTSIVTVERAPVITATSTTICVGGNTTITSTGVKPGPISWQRNSGSWTTVAGQTGTSLLVTESGEYRMQVITASCTLLSNTVTITEVPKDAAGPDVTLCTVGLSNPIVLSGNPAGGTWSLVSGTGFSLSGNNLTWPTSLSPGQSRTATVRYTVDGCTDTKLVTVERNQNAITRSTCDRTSNFALPNITAGSVITPIGTAPVVNNGTVDLSGVNVATTVIYQYSVTPPNSTCPYNYTLEVLGQMAVVVSTVNPGVPNYCSSCGPLNFWRFTVTNIAEMFKPAGSNVMWRLFTRSGALVSGSWVPQSTGTITLSGLNAFDAPYNLVVRAVQSDGVTTKATCQEVPLTLTVPASPGALTQRTITLNDPAFSSSFYCSNRLGTLNLNFAGARTCNSSLITTVNQVRVRAFSFEDNSFLGEFSGTPASPTSLAANISSIPLLAKQGGFSRVKFIGTVLYNGSCVDTFVVFRRYEHCCSTEDYTTVHPGDVTISTNTTWTGTHHVRGNILIQPGSTLVLDGASVAFAGEAGFTQVDSRVTPFYQRPLLTDPNRLQHRIVLVNNPIEGPPSNLELLNGAKIFGACGSMWEGIKSIGSANNNTVTVTSTPGTEIRDAESAFEVIPNTSNTPYTGSLTLNLGALKIENCYRGVRFNDSHGRLFLSGSPQIFTSNHLPGVNTRRALKLPFSYVHNVRRATNPGPENQYQYIGLHGLDLTLSNRVNNFTLDNWKFTNLVNGISILQTPTTAVANGTTPVENLILNRAVFDSMSHSGVIVVEQPGNTVLAARRMRTTLNFCRSYRHAYREENYWTEQTDASQGAEDLVRLRISGFEGGWQLPVVGARGAVIVDSCLFQSADAFPGSGTAPLRSAGVIGLSEIDVRRTQINRMGQGILSYASHHTIEGNEFRDNAEAIHIAGHGLDAVTQLPLQQTFTSFGCNRFYAPVNTYNQLGIYFGLDNGVVQLGTASAQTGSGPIGNSWPALFANGTSALPYDPANPPSLNQLVIPPNFTALSANANNPVTYWAYANEADLIPPMLGVTVSNPNLDCVNQAPLQGQTQVCNNYLGTTQGWYPYRIGVTSNGREQAPTQITLYPNPTTHQLTLQGLPAEVTEVEVVDGLGRHATLHVQNAQVTVSHLASGLYRMRVTTATGVQTLNFVKQ